MSSEWTFNRKRPSEHNETDRGSEGNAIESISEYIESLYTQLLELDFNYIDLYEMTVQELIDTLMARRRGLAYKIWKEAYLIAWATMGKHYAQTPENASPELYPPKPTIKMPDNLLNEELKKRGEIIYE